MLWLLRLEIQRRDVSPRAEKDQVEDSSVRILSKELRNDLINANIEMMVDNLRSDPVFLRDVLMDGWTGLKCESDENLLQEHHSLFLEYAQEDNDWSSIDKRIVEEVFRDW